MNPAIRTRSLTKSFSIDTRPPREISVLRGIDLEIAAGESVALLGPSGSGKSTLLAILAGLDRPSAGTVRIHDQELTELNPEELTRFRATKMGFVFQAFQLIPTLNAIENVALPLELLDLPSPRARAQEALSRLGLSDRLDHFPRQLSGGEQQRIAVARAMITRPQVIFADEPTGNLDSANSRIVLEDLLSLRGKSTLVMVTHDESIAEKLDRVIRLRDGQIESSSKGAGSSN